MIYTVLPLDNETLPQDFATREEANEYAVSHFEDGEYLIESVEGEVY